MTMEIELLLRPRGQERADVILDGQVLCTSRQPLLDGARALQALGYPADALVRTRWQGAAHWSLRAPVGQAAQLRGGEEDVGGLRIREWIDPESVFAARRPAGTLPSNSTG